jgi:hypothetical protein
MGASYLQIRKRRCDKNEKVAKFQRGITKNGNLFARFIGKHKKISLGF